MTKLTLLSRLAILLVVFVFSETVSPAKETVFYISTQGNDAWSGKLPAPNAQKSDGPFASLERAREAIREIKQSGKLPKGGVTVFLREGIYFRDQSFQLTEADSGSETSPIVYKNYPKEKAQLVGGRKITGFKPVEDTAVLSRIEEAARTHILQTDLKAQGITDYGQIRPRGFGRPIQPAALELFFQNQPMTLARWPNGDWTKIAAVPPGKDGGKFTYAGDRPLRWSKAEEIWLHGYWTWDWAESYEKVSSIDTERHEIATAPPHGVYGYTAGKRYYALNLLEELDEPGEWFLDRKTGVLYFRPPASLDSGEVFVSLLEKPLLSMKNVTSVTFAGLTFAFTRGNAVEIEGGEHNYIDGCLLQNIGDAAVQIRGGRDNGVRNCEIAQCGEGGIILQGGDRMTLTPGDNFADNNHIHHFSRWARTYRPAVMVEGVGNRVTHNLMHDSPHMAIGLGGNEHRIEFNEVHTVCMETADCGAFYMGRDWTQRGNQVRYNFFHHLGHGDVNAIYLDDWSSGTTVFGNVCYRAGRGILLGGGRDNTIDNNIFVECKPSVHVDARGLGWAKNYFDGSDTTLTDRMKAVHADRPPYSQRYPELVTLYADEPAVPKGNVIRHNISLGGQWLDLLDKLTDKIVKIENNLVNEDPHFVDPEQSDFRLKEDSPAFKLGFQKIPFEQIGLRKTNSAQAK